jgi:hypothetical protein
MDPRDVPALIVVALACVSAAASVICVGLMWSRINRFDERVDWPFWFWELTALRRQYVRTARERGWPLILPYVYWGSLAGFLVFMALFAYAINRLNASR